jgi:hypothetical protein
MEDHGNLSGDGNLAFFIPIRFASLFPAATVLIVRGRR